MFSRGVPSRTGEEVRLVLPLPLSSACALLGWLLRHTGRQELGGHLSRTLLPGSLFLLGLGHRCHLEELLANTGGRAPAYNIQPHDISWPANVCILEKYNMQKRFGKLDSAQGGHFSVYWVTQTPGNVIIYERVKYSVNLKTAI